MSSSIEFYHQHLQRVSRSFSVCIAELNTPLREQISLTYLLCRLLDSIEDSPWQNPAKQQLQFENFQNFLSQCPTVSEYSHWANQMPQDIPEGELDLLKDGLQILKDLHTLSQEVREIILDSVKTMGRGMAAVVGTRTDRGLRLNSSLELDHYCFFVAGIIGEVLTRLAFRSAFPMTPLSALKNSIQQKLISALDFGLFLQKVNILKDQREDAARGCYYISNLNDTLRDLGIHAEKSIEYLLSLPEDWKPFRIFCSFSLALGLVSLPHLLAREINAGSTNTEGTQSIPRSETLQLLKHLKEIAGDNQRLGDFLQDGLGLLRQGLQFAESSLNFSAPISTPDPSEVSRFDPIEMYSGLISKLDLTEYFSRRLESRSNTCRI